LQRLSLSFHDQARTGDLLLRLASDVDAVKVLLIEVPANFAYRLSVIVLHVGLMLYLDWRLAMIAFSVIPILWMFNRRIGGEVKGAASTKRSKETEIASLIAESVTAMALVQAYGREDLQQARFESENRASLASGLAAMKLSKAFRRTGDILEALGTCAVLYYGGRLTLAGMISPGTVVLFVAYLKNLYTPLGKFADMMLDAASAQVSGDRLLELFECDMVMEDAPGAVPAPPFRGRVEFVDVSFGYRKDTPVLKNVSFAVEPGETVAVIGHNGAGKSTVLGLLLRFYDPQQGRILIDGHDLRDMTLKSLRSQITVVMQDARLFNKSVRDNIGFGKIGASEEEIVRAARLAQAHDFILRMPGGYDTMIREGGENLSGGERQRLNIARAIVRDTPIVILDEAGTALDARTEALVQEALHELTCGKTSFVVAHKLSTVSGAHKILMLDDGTITAFGTRDELLDSCREYREICALQAAPAPVPVGPERAARRHGRMVDIPEGCEFSQLREIADGDRLAQVLERTLRSCAGSDGLSVERCTVEQLHYHPGQGCRLLVGATIRARDARASEEQVFFCQLFAPDQARAVYESSDRTNLAPPRFGPPILYIPEWAMVLWAYPNDPDLPGLPVMMNARAVRERLAASPWEFELESAPTNVSPQLVKYVPGRRCGVLYRVELERPSALDGDGARYVYGKVYHRNDGARAYAIMKGVWESAARERGDVVLPRPYAYDPATGIVWQEALLSRPLLKDPANHGRLPEWADEIGARLAALHDMPLELPVEMNLAFQIEMVRRSLAFSERVPSAPVERSRAVAERLLAVATRFDEGPSATVHGSFKLSHVLATTRGIAFIDFDGANSGDPTFDLGRFVAHVLKMAAMGKITPDTADETIRNFNSAYRRAARIPLAQERIDWATAAHLVSGGLDKSVKRMDRRAMEALVAVADRLCPS
jgi:ABC-type multidrug transport system fused ATPase/permease subunit